jgi:G patch domain/KOW motif-containing protein
MAEPARVAFKLGGFKRPALNNSVSSAIQFDSSTINNNDQPELVTGFDNGEIKSDAPKVIKKELVIAAQPNAHHKFFKLKTSLQKSVISTEAINQLDDDAKRALILEAQEANEAWNERTENGTIRVHTIEQDSANTFTNHLENDNKTTAEEEEKEIENADYEQVPIEEFGMAVLRGMGYKEDSGLGITNKKQVNVFVPESRPRGLGLGADRKVLEKINQLKRNLKKSGIDEKDDLCFEKGAFVLIEKGPHCDLYGTIESIEEDLARLTVSLAVGGTNRKKEVISISQYNVKLVTEKEFLKYSKYVNKSKAEQVEKETSDQLMKDYHRRDPKKDDDDDYKRHRSSKTDDKDDERKHRHHSSNGHRHRHEESSRSRKH